VPGLRSTCSPGIVRPESGTSIGRAGFDGGRLTGSTDRFAVMARMYGMTGGWTRDGGRSAARSQGLIPGFAHRRFVRYHTRSTGAEPGRCRIRLPPKGLACQLRAASGTISGMLLHQVAVMRLVGHGTAASDEQEA
jgi:hypothetical protein